MACITPLKKGREITGALVIATDISDRKEMEEDLRERENKFRNLCDEAPISIMQFDKEHIINFLTNVIWLFSREKIRSRIFVG